MSETNLDVTFYNDQNLMTDEQIAWSQDLLDLAYKTLDLKKPIEMSVSFVDEVEIHEINLKYRNKDRATDVISFAINDEDDLSAFEDQIDLPKDIGDLFICPSVVEEHAKEYQHSNEREYGYTLVHGFLHLNGYDHIDPDEEKEMIGLQKQILDAYGLEK